MNPVLAYLHYFFFNVYPYICMAVFLMGSLARERDLGGGEQVCVRVRGPHYLPWIPARVRGSTIT